MKFVWLLYLIQLFVYMLINPLIFNHEIGLLILIGIHILFVFIFMLQFNNKMRLVFYGAFVTRFIVMLSDVYMRDWISIPHSGNDTETFLGRAISVSNSFSSIIETSYEFFIKVTALTFRITAKERIIAQYTNVLLGFTIVYLIYLIFKKLNISNKNILIGTVLTAFFPHSLFFSGILLREMFSTFFVVASLYFLVKWYMDTHKISFYMSILMLLISSLFHSGVIGFLLAHIFIYLFYDKKSKKLDFSVKTILYFVSLALFLMWFFGVYEWNNLAIFRKLNIDSIEEVYNISSNRSGKSAYLTGLSINNIFEMIIFTPIFMLFFISSPLPMNWRGINDIFSFMLDGIVYLGIGIYIISNIKSRKYNHKELSIIILAGLLGVLIIFSLGVQNAGTALRHRHKVFHLFLLIYIIMKDKKVDEPIKTRRSFD